MGGDELTIVGQGFEFVHMADNSVKIYSADMADMACDVTSVMSTGSEGHVSFCDTPGPDVNLFRTRGSFFSSGLTRTDFTFISFHGTGGEYVLPAVIYFSLFNN